MTAAKKRKEQTDLASMVCRLQDLAEQIHRQVDQELARLEQARLLAAQESDRLEALLAKTHSNSNPCSQDLQQVLGRPGFAGQASRSDGQAGLFDKHRQVYDLSSQGLGPLEIAQRTGQSLGEIQVILALRKSE